MIELALKLIERKIQDSSYTDDDFVDLINVCIGEIASTEALPFLVKHADITVDEGSFTVALPGDYHSNLLRVQNLETKREIRVRTLSEALEIYPDLNETGEVVLAAPQGGSTLLVRRTPTADTQLRVWYHQQPEIIEDKEDEVHCIPKHLQLPLFVNYVCAQIYSEIEDGVEGRNINTQFYTSKYFQARADLREHLGVPDAPFKTVLYSLDSGRFRDITDEI